MRDFGDHALCYKYKNVTGMLQMKFILLSVSSYKPVNKIFQIFLPSAKRSWFAMSNGIVPQLL